MKEIPSTQKIPITLLIQLSDHFHDSTYPVLLLESKKEIERNVFTVQFAIAKA